VLRLDDPLEAGETLNVRLNPIDERPTGGDEAHVEPLIHVALVLRRVIPIDVHQDVAIAVDAARKKSGKYSSGMARGPSVRLLAGVRPIMRSAS